MNIPETLLRIVQNRNCPLYEQNDQFILSGRSLQPPDGKATCMVLVGDIKADLADADLHAGEAAPIHQFACSGPATDCTGEIRMEYSIAGKAPPARSDREGRPEPRKEKLQAILRLLARFEMFQGLGNAELRDLAAILKYRQLEAGTTVVRQGEPGVNLYLIASGRVAVRGDDGVDITELKRGEVFGEMSLISGEPTAATIQVVEPARLLYIKGRDFGRVLKRFPSLQMYFARLLASRLARTNTAQSEMLRSGMTGRLEEVAPAELFQTFNVNSKSGTLSLSLTHGAARVAFRDGELVSAAYDGKSGVDAFFAILGESRGRFSYHPDIAPEERDAPEIGDFMWLLMEGIRRIDEAKEGN